MDTADTISVKLRLKLNLDMDTTTTTTSSASASLTSSVTRSQSRTSVKSAMRNMMSLLTLFTYIEECQDIITTQCLETSQQVQHSSAVVGHDSQVVSHGHAGYGYGKRDADAEAQPGYSTGPQCHDKKDRQCHKKPVQNSRKVPRPVCKTVVDTTYIEECEETFTTQCHTAHTQVHHSSAVVGHDSQVVAHSHSGHGGYKKREANAEAEPGYGPSSGPQCHAQKDRQCQKPVQSSH